MIGDSLIEKQLHHCLHGPREEFIQGARRTFFYTQWLARTVYWCDVARVTIDVLPGLALLEIFDFYVHEASAGIEAWHTLVHVCRKWRNIVFDSPCRLDLRLYYSARRPVMGMRTVWPLLPIVIMVRSYRPWSLDNLVAALLEHNERICELDLGEIRGGQLDKVWAAMQKPFPALTRLEILPVIRLPPAVPASFLGGSAPRLRSLSLQSIPFPGVLNLLLSATYLVHLHLWRIPHSEYFSPEAIATCLSVLTRLERLSIGFESPLIHPDRRPPPQTRTLLPFLTGLWFEGFSEYLEDLVARIDAPLLNNLAITFLPELIFDTPQLVQFISRAPKFQSPDEAHVVFSKRNISVFLSQTFGTPMKLPMDRALKLTISCTQPDQQLASLAQVCSSSFPQALVSAVEHLYIIEGRYSGLHWQDDIENSQWLELLHPFTSVKSLYISEEFVLRIAPALQGVVGERVTEVLPALQSLFLGEKLLSGSVQEAFERFIAARQLANHPISISRWEGKHLG